MFYRIILSPLVSYLNTVILDSVIHSHDFKHSFYLAIMISAQALLLTSRSFSHMDDPQVLTTLPLNSKSLASSPEYILHLISPTLTHGTTIFSVFQATRLGGIKTHIPLFTLLHSQSRALSVFYFLGNFWDALEHQAAS